MKELKRKKKKQLVGGRKRLGKSSRNGFAGETLEVSVNYIVEEFLKKKGIELIVKDLQGNNAKEYYDHICKFIMTGIAHSDLCYDEKGKWI